MYLSVVIPLLNEAENIEKLYLELSGVLDGIQEETEMVFIDDGSVDESVNLLKNLQEKDPRIVIISFRKNFGQTAAMSAGFDHAVGDIIITMDADLQNDPKDIPDMLEKVKQGYDVVCGWRFDRKDAFINRKLPSMIANWIISTVTGVKLHDYGCTLKAFRKEITRNIRLYGELHRFIPAIASGMGTEIAEVKVNHRARQFGQSKYGISRTIRVVLDLITVKFLLSYATRPIQVFGLFGAVSGFAGMLLTLFLIIQRQFFAIPLGNRPMLLFAFFLIFMGIQFVTLGLLAELQARTSHETQQKPIYSIREIFRAGENKKA
ncbi:MAG: glycosyltransferase family 2 protein [Desulfocapsa sp.]|nr:glycosyltransferase family 2 protein [Desulfocapsa sp.]